MNILDIITDSPINAVREKLDRERYFATPGLNPSTIVHRRKSALAAKHAYEEGFSDTEAKLFGRFCHTLLFESDRIDLDWAVWEGDRRGNAWEEFQAANAGKEIIKAGDQQYGAGRALCAVTRALLKPKLRKLVAEGVPEVAVFASEGQVQCKGRIDWIDTAGGNIVDAKFTNDIAPKVFGRSSAGFGYHIKMACYREWFQRVSGKQINGVYLLTIETQPPFDVAVVPIRDDQLEDGWAQARELIAQIAHNCRTNSWPGVDEGKDTIDLDLPYWALMEQQEVIYE